MSLSDDTFNQEKWQGYDTSKSNFVLFVYLVNDSFKTILHQVESAAVLVVRMSLLTSFKSVWYQQSIKNTMSQRNCGYRTDGKQRTELNGASAQHHWRFDRKTWATTLWRTADRAQWCDETNENRRRTRIYNSHYHHNKWQQWITLQ